jgi:hypothetical protein
MLSILIHVYQGEKLNKFSLVFTWTHTTWLVARATGAWLAGAWLATNAIFGVFTRATKGVWFGLSCIRTSRSVHLQTSIQSGAAGQLTHAHSLAAEQQTYNHVDKVLFSYSYATWIGCDWKILVELLTYYGFKHTNKA